LKPKELQQELARITLADAIKPAKVYKRRASVQISFSMLSWVFALFLGFNLLLIILSVETKSTFGLLVFLLGSFMLVNSFTLLARNLSYSALMDRKKYVLLMEEKANAEDIHNSEKSGSKDVD
jgi:hypothetical protein